MSAVGFQSLPIYIFKPPFNPDNKLSYTNATKIFIFEEVAQPGPFFINPEPDNLRPVSGNVSPIPEPAVQKLG